MSMNDGESIHYENLPMKYTEIFSAVKMKISSAKILIFLIFLLKAKIADTR